MAAAPVRLEREGDVGIVIVDNPPANATSAAVRAGLAEAVETLAGDPALLAGVIMGAGGTFVAGADIKEFDKPVAEPALPAVIAAIERCRKPILAAISGPALGGGLELALGCDGRIATGDAILGLPEVTLGVVPGAGGTQRLPRLVGLPKAIELIATGRRIGAAEAVDLGIIDRVVEGPLRAAAIAHARTMTGKRVVGSLSLPAADAAAVDATVGAQLKRARGQAARAAIDLVLLAVRLPLAEALQKERETFLALRSGEEAAALRHLFFAERAARKVDNPDRLAPRPIRSVGIVGGGTMGAGIAATFAACGFAVTLHDASAEALARAKVAVASALDDLKRSGGSADATVAFAEDLASLSASDLFIEAVFEEIDVKTEIVRRLGAMAKDGAVIASNTSYLDLDTIAAASGRPATVLGLHFFAPAHRMKLLEVVRGTATSLETLLTGLEIARRLGKIAVVAGVGEGFIGNRIFSRYRAQAEFLLEEGALPEEVDAAAEELGFAMGPFAVSDLSGLDISWRIRRSKAATRDPRLRYVPIADRLCEAGRLGRKTGMGWYDYPDGGKGRGVPSPVVTTMIEGTRPEKYRGQRPDRAAIGRRLLGAIVNEAANALEDGVARQPGDIDVVLVQGYGYSRLKGGPVFQALRMAPAEVAAMVDAVAAATGFGFRRGDLRRLGIVV